MVPVALVVIFGTLFILRSIVPLDLLKVGISTLQVIANANSVYSIPWPVDFGNLLDVMKIFLVGKTDCKTPSRGTPDLTYKFVNP